MKHTIAVGSEAPNFSAVDALGEPVKFRSPHASSYVLLVFLRYAGCPYCNLAIERLCVEYALLRKSGCEVLVIVNSDAEKIQKNIHARHKQTLPFRIIPDPRRKLYAVYGVTPRISAVGHLIKNIPYWLKATADGYGQKAMDGNFFIVPAFFLVDRKGSVVLADYAANFYDDSTFTPIYECLTFGV